MDGPAHKYWIERLVDELERSWANGGCSPNSSGSDLNNAMLCFGAIKAVEGSRRTIHRVPCTFSISKQGLQTSILL